MMEDARPALAELEQAIGYHFENPALLEEALRHSSYSHEHEREANNERLEFLGDAVIGLVVAGLLFEAHPDWSEGDLTRGLHRLVDRRSLSRVGQDLGLGAFVQLGRTEIRSQGSVGKARIVGNAMEAVSGAVYLDAGLAAVEALARRIFGGALLPSAPRAPRDAKTRFQELVMERYGEFPTYELVADSESEDDEERFSVVARVRGEAWAEGAGRSKRRAEHAAAERGLASLESADE